MPAVQMKSPPNIDDLLKDIRQTVLPPQGNGPPPPEKVKKGSETIYRARFAGLTDTKAEAACKSLKRSGLSCFTTKN
jgi:D-alanyl-D-alanine carboxypeptidase